MRSQNPSSPRSEEEKMVDLDIISDLYLKGVSVQEIHNQINVRRPYSLSQNTIRNDIETIQQMWFERVTGRMGQAKAEELAKIDRIEREAWRAWEASLTDKETTVSENVQSEGGRKTRAQVKRESQTGSSEYLRIVQWCIDKRCEILGVYAAANAVNSWQDEIVMALRNGLTTPRHVLLAYPDVAEQIILKSGLQIPEIVEGEYEEA